MSDQTLFLFIKAFAVLFDRLEGFRAYDVLDLAGILGCGFAVNAERDEKIGQYRVAFVKTFCGFDALFGQRDEARAVNVDVFARLEDPDGAADARLGISHTLCDVNGAHRGRFSG